MKQVRKKHTTKRPPKPAYMKQQTAAGVAVQFRRGIKGTDNILFDGRPSIAFVGRSNVGKSSSINAILGSAVARTSTTPGKTQEINFFEVGAKGYFVDLPGYGYARMPAADQDKVRKHILWYLSGGEAKPKLIVLIIDIRVGITEHDRELIGVAHDEGHPLVVLANKVDKLSGNEFPKAMQALIDEFPDIDIIPFSAVKRTHIAAVRKMLFGVLGIK